MAREMVEPTGALDDIIQTHMRPMSMTLFSVVADLLDGKADDHTLRLCSMSVVSQVLFYHHCRPVVMRMFPDMKFDAEGIEEISAHITRFSLVAIREQAARKVRSAKSVKPVKSRKTAK